MKYNLQLSSDCSKETFRWIFWGVFLFLFSISLYPTTTQARGSSGGAGFIDFTVGATNATSGRSVPLLSLGFGSDSSHLSAASFGSQSKLYYQSGYFLTYQWTGKFPPIIAGELIAGMGLGAFYSESSYKDGSTATAKVTQSTDFGPSFEVRWQFLSHMSLNFVGIWGMTAKPANVLLLSAQDIGYVSLGVLW